MDLVDKMRTKRIIYTRAWSTAQYRNQIVHERIYKGTYNHKQFQIYRFLHTDDCPNDTGAARLPRRAVESDVPLAGRRLQRDLLFLASPVDVVALDDITFEVVQEHFLMGPTY